MKTHTETGRVALVGDTEKYTRKDGTETARRLLVIETQDRYADRVAFELWGDRASTLNMIRPGDVVNVDFRLRSWQDTPARAYALGVSPALPDSGGPAGASGKAAGQYASAIYTTESPRPAAEPRPLGSDLPF